MADEVWGYAWERDPEGWMGACATREEAIEEAMAEMQQPPVVPASLCEVWIVRGTPREARAYMPDAERVLEWMGEHAYDDGATEDEGWPEVSDEAKAELGRLLVEWADRHCPEALWYAEGKPERVWPKEPALDTG